MSVITIHEAKTQLSKLIQRALEGEEIVIAKRDQPLVRLQVIEERRPVRSFGDLKYLVLAMGDSFNDELTDFVDYGPPSFGQLKAAEEPAPYGKK